MVTRSPAMLPIDHLDFVEATVLSSGVVGMVAVA